MSAQAIVKIGPHGGKIVGFHGTKPIYLGSPEAAKFEHQAPAGSPAEKAGHHDLGVSVHPTQHDHLQIASRGDGSAAKLEAWANASGGLPAGTFITKSSFGAHALVPRAWAEKGAPVVAPAPPPSPAPTPAPAPAKAAAPAASPVDELVAKAGLTPVDVATLTNPISKWTESPNHPVTVGGKAGELVGWALDDAKPRKKAYPPKLVVRFPGVGPLGGKVAAFPASDVVPVPGAPLNPPWHGQDVKVWKSPKASAAMNGLLAEAAPGQNGKTRGEVIAIFAKAGVAAYPMGGFVRDAIQGKQSKDIDMSFNADWPHVTSVAAKNGLVYENPGNGGLVKLGVGDADNPPLEGKSFMGVNADRHSIAGTAPSSTGHSFADEAMYGDCSHGRLWYDPVNDVIIDPTGRGVEDTVTHTYSLPVAKEKWESWAAGSPDKLWRFWKFAARGDKPADEETRQFIVAKAKQYFGKSEWTSAHNLKVRLRGVVGNGADSQKKYDAFKGAVVADMGQDFWDKHWAPVKPYHVTG